MITLPNRVTKPILNTLLTDFGSDKPTPNQRKAHYAEVAEALVPRDWNVGHILERIIDPDLKAEVEAALVVDEA
jgi:hypothetical protein